MTEAGRLAEGDRPDAAQVPLCVDLDGTLIRTDLLAESTFALLKQAPHLAFALPIWLLRGRQHLKRQIAERVDLDVEALPYDADLLQRLRQARADGRRLVLATASNETFARAVAEHLGIFDQVVASDAASNLKGRAKAARLVELFGDGGFDYAGDAPADLQVWEHARAAILVRPSRRLARIAEGRFAIDGIIGDDRRRGKDYLRAMRLHQWVKNLLLFIPLLAGHKIAEPQLVWQAALAFLAFGFCASSVYLLNDLLDLSTDRRHPRKRRRPFAAGDLPISHGIVLIPLLLASAFAITLVLPPLFAAVLAGYYLLTLAYSLWLKQRVLVDAMTLACLYTVRVIAGGAAVSIAPSFWLLAFSMFLFLSLAMVKRYAELIEIEAQGGAQIRGRGYQVVDLETLTSLGAASGYVAVLVLAFYINSPDVRVLYGAPEIIWLLCPIMLYWISRMWFASRRGKMHDDPIVFAARDSVSRWCFVASAGVLAAAVYGHTFIDWLTS